MSGRSYKLRKEKIEENKNCSIVFGAVKKKSVLDTRVSTSHTHTHAHDLNRYTNPIDSINSIDSIQLIFGKKLGKFGFRVALFYVNSNLLFDFFLYFLILYYFFRCTEFFEGSDS